MSDSQAETELVPVGTGPDLEQMDRADAPAIWSGYLEKFTSLKASADSVLASDPSNPMSAKLARTARLEFRKARIEIEAKRKELGETYLRKKQAVDGEANKLKDLIEPYEEKLLAIEQHAERVESDRIEALAVTRMEAVAPFLSPGQPLPDLRVITEEQFQTLLTDIRTLHEGRIEAALKSERERLAKEKADAEERERMRLENERLKKEAEEREAQAKAERDRAEKARVEAETKARKEREAIEAKARDEREEAESKLRKEQDEINDKSRAHRLELEAEREAAEAKAAVERAAREKLEREKKAREEAEAKRVRDAEKAAKKAAAAPDREKLAAFVLLLRGLPLPALTTRNGALVKADLEKRVESLAEWIETEANEI